MKLADIARRYLCLPLFWDRLAALRSCKSVTRRGRRLGLETLETREVPAVVSGRMWADDGDGVQQPGEAGVQQSVTLTGQSGGQSFSANTDAAGNYTISGVSAGTYRLLFSGSSVGSAFAPKDAGWDDTADSDVNPDGYTDWFAVSEGQQITHLDAGVLPDSSGSSGWGGSVSGRVWDDADGDGVQDPGEAGIPGVSVNLLDSYGGWLGSATPDADGRYSFSGLAARDYRVQVSADSGWAFSPRWAADPALDSDADTAGYTQPVTLSDGQEVTHLDAGLHYVGSGGSGGSGGSVSGRVWIDEGYGFQDLDEIGLSEVWVSLQDVQGSVVATTLTDDQGVYWFTGLAPSSVYRVQVIAPDGYDFTEQYAAPPSHDSDADSGGFTRWFSALAIGSIVLDVGLVAAPAAVPQLEFRKPGPTSVTTLRVGTWENAFEKRPGAADITIKDNFIDLDPRRFYVRVIDAAANADPNTEDTIRVRIATSSDVGNEIALMEWGVNTGVFVSDYLLLTSMKRDDEYRASGVADNTLGDRTFLVKLGDTVTMRYNGLTRTANVPVLASVKLNINILLSKRMADGGAPVITTEKVNELVAAANEIYAPAGIKFTATVNMPVDPPAGVDLTDGFQGYSAWDENGRMIMTAEEKALFDTASLRTASTADVEVYFVNSFTGSPARGEAFSAAGVPDPKYADTTVLRGDAEYSTLAHELGHILSMVGTHPDGSVGVNETYLMSRPMKVSGDINDSLRFTTWYCGLLLSKRPNLLLRP